MRIHRTVRPLLNFRLKNIIFITFEKLKPISSILIHLIDLDLNETLQLAEANFNLLGVHIYMELRLCQKITRTRNNMTFYY